MVQQNQVIVEDLGVQKILQKFQPCWGQDGCRMSHPNNPILFICDPTSSLPPPRSQAVMEIITICIDNLFKKNFLLEL